MTSQEIRELIARGNKLSPKEGFRQCELAYKQGKRPNVVIKISEDEFRAWYNSPTKRNPHWEETLEEETTYVTGVCEKAFRMCCGYSIFATSLADKIRVEKYPNYSCPLDRIEHLEFEWIIIED